MRQKQLLILMLNHQRRKERGGFKQNNFNFLHETLAIFKNRERDSLARFQIPGRSILISILSIENNTGKNSTLFQQRSTSAKESWRAHCSSAVRQLQHSSVMPRGAKKRKEESEVKRCRRGGGGKKKIQKEEEEEENEREQRRERGGRLTASQRHLEAEEARGSICNSHVSAKLSGPTSCAHSHCTSFSRCLLGQGKTLRKETLESALEKGGVSLSGRKLRRNVPTSFSQHPAGWNKRKSFPFTFEIPLLLVLRMKFVISFLFFFFFLRLYAGIINISVCFESNLYRKI